MLSKEFRNLLNRHSKPVPVATLMDMLMTPDEGGFCGIQRGMVNNYIDIVIFTDLPPLEHLPGITKDCL